MATHSSVLAWEMPWTEGPDGYSPWGRKEPDRTERLTLSLSGSITGAGGRLPLQRAASKKHQLPPRPLGSTQGSILAPRRGAPAGLRPELMPRPSCPAPPTPARRTHRACRLLIRPSMSRCPAEYCSMTSFTSYGRSVSLNFLLATRNFRILQGRESQRTDILFQPALCPLLPCLAQGHLLPGPPQTATAGSPASLPPQPPEFVWSSLIHSHWDSLDWAWFLSAGCDTAAKDSLGEDTFAYAC